MLAARGGHLPNAAVYAISQQLRQFDQLRNAKQLLAFRTFQVKRQVATQRIGRGECFAEVDQQVFGADAICHGEQPDGGFGVGLIIVKLLNLSGAATDRRDAMGVAAVRRFADRRLRKPAYPKVSRAQPP